jgi:hypothetical protein
VLSTAFLFVDKMRQADSYTTTQNVIAILCFLNPYRVLFLIHKSVVTFL